MLLWKLATSTRCLSAAGMTRSRIDAAAVSLSFAA